MNYRNYLNIILLLFVTSNLFAQRTLKISVIHKGKTEFVSSVVRNGVSYVSTIGLSKILGASFYYNTEAAKVEMKFENYRLKVTGRNQFVVLSSADNYVQSVFQIPISTLLMKDDVFMPLIYTLKYLQIASSKEMLFDEKEKQLVITGKKYSVNLADVVPTSLKNVEPPKKENVEKEIINTGYDVYSLLIEEKTNGTLIRLKTNKQINRFSSSISEGKLRLFISGASVDPGIIKKVQPVGFIRKAELKRIQGNVQIEFLLKDGFSTHESIKDIDSDDLIVTIHNNMFSDFVKNIDKEKEEWNFDVVVIDPGHGGKDAGAIGVTGVKEKDINLKIALKLGQIIKKEMPDVKVVYTRDSDEFIELYKRGKIANENNGKLFLSIHCNSLKKKNSPISGFEVYLLRPGKTDKAIEIAEFENSVISLEDNPDRYQKLTDENFILVSMAHSAYMRYSEKFSDILNRQWSKNIKSIPSRGIKQAGFYVLVGASMPGVLIEAGFLSNKNDEKHLNSSKGQQEIASAIFKTVKEYKQYYEAQMAAE